MKNTHQTIKLSIIAASLFHLPAFAANSPFADLPLHLQNKSQITGAQGVKPNVLLQIDDSGSMAWEDRMPITKRALNQLIKNPEYRDHVNWNLISLHDTASSRSTAYQRNRNWRFAVSPNEIERQIIRLNPSGGTPSTTRYTDAILMMREAMLQPGTYRCQKNYIIIFSDGDANSETLTTFYTQRLNNMTWQDKQKARNFAGTGYDWTIVGSGGYRSNAWYNLYTNGKSEVPSIFKPNKIVNFFKYPVWWPTSYQYYSNNMMSFLAHSVYEEDWMTAADGVDAAGKSWDDDTVIDGKTPNKTQNITTFTIGFGSGLSSNGREYLSFAATGNNRQVLNASNQAELDAAFKKIFDQIRNENQIVPPQSFSTVSPAVMGDSKVSNAAPRTAAVLQLNLQAGSSELRFYDVNNLHLPYKLADYSARRTIARNASGQTVWFDGSYQASNDAFKLNGGRNRDEWKNALIPWLNRSQDDARANSQSGNSQTYRVRATQPANQRDMGDVVNAPLVTATPTDPGTKRAIRYDGRMKYLVTAANDGMVYLFEQKDNTNPYQLKLNYMPLGMQRESDTDLMQHYLKNVAHEKYIKDPAFAHEYLVDGGIVVRNTDSLAPEQIFLAGNMGRGGRGAYALNLGGTSRADGKTKVGLDAAQTQWTSSVPLFETSKTNNTMGYTIGSPQIGRVALQRSTTIDATTQKITKQTVNLGDLKYGVFVSSGIKHPTQKENTETALYVYNGLGHTNVGMAGSGNVVASNHQKAGDLIGKIVIQESGRGGLLQPTLVDTDFDGAIDVVYAGDYRGGLYRFDLRAGGADKWTVSKIFQAQTGQVITSAPAVHRIDHQNYVVIFGTGSDLFQSDLTDKTVQSIYGIYDDLTVTKPQVVQQAQLVQQTFSSSANTRTATDNHPTLANDIKKIDPVTKLPVTDKRGWFANFPAGERVVVKPNMVLKTVMFTTRNFEVKQSAIDANKDVCIPSTNTVQSSGSSWQMQLKADNGGQISVSAKGKSPYAYADFHGLIHPGSQGTPIIYSGYHFADGIGAVTFTAFAGDNPSMAGNVGNAYSLDGDAGGTGKDIDPGANNTDKDNKPKACIAHGKGALYVVDSSTGLNTPVSIHGSTCVVSLKRLSWREIF